MAKSLRGLKIESAPAMTAEAELKKITSLMGLGLNANTQWLEPLLSLKITLGTGPSNGMETRTKSYKDLISTVTYKVEVYRDRMDLVHGHGVSGCGVLVKEYYVRH